MQLKNRWWVSMLMLSIVSFATITLIRITSASGSNATSSQQDVIRLENRLTQLEQRLYSMETSIRTLEQQSRLSNMSSRNVNQEEIASMHSEIQVLQRRLIDDECGLAKLDERTLSPERRRRSVNDPCRLNFEAPLRLPDR